MLAIYPASGNRQDNIMATGRKPTPTVLKLVKGNPVNVPSTTEAVVALSSQRRPPV